MLIGLVVFVFPFNRLQSVRALNSNHELEVGEIAPIERTEHVLKVLRRLDRVVNVEFGYLVHLWLNFLS